jgi:hypothetical protein
MPGSGGPITMGESNSCRGPRSAPNLRFSSHASKTGERTCRRNRAPQARRGETCVRGASLGRWRTVRLMAVRFSRFRGGARWSALIAVAVIVLALLPLSQAAAKGYGAGYYTGRTSQGKAISFVVANGEVSYLYSQLTDNCKPGKWYVTLYPKPARIDAHGHWFRRTPGAFPTVYHGQVGARTASGTIDDLSQNSAGRRCRGHVSFHASRSAPLRVGTATVGARGTDVLLKLAVPAGLSGGVTVPYTNLALLVYGSNSGCPSTYRAADALARTAQSDGFIGLISDAYVSADYGFALTRGYIRGSFTFDVSTNTLLPAPSGGSPFSTVCAMLYSGTPATLTPSRNVSLGTTHGRLVPGPGIPNTQP